MVEDAQKVIDDAKAAQDEVFNEWNRKLSIDEMVDLYRERLVAEHAGVSDTTILEREEAG